MSENRPKSPIFGDLYRYIYNNQETSRKQIAQDLGLSLPTIANNLQQLIDEDFIYIDGTSESTGGRKPNTYTCNPSAMYAIGLDITRNHLNIVLIDLSENIVDSERIRLAFEDTDEYYSYAAEKIEELLTANSIRREKLLGVGVSVPALLKEDQKTIGYLKVLDTDGQVYEHMAKFMKYPFLLYNDADSAGLAEWWLTTNRNTAVYIALNPSIGGATINGKNIYTGDNNRASEFGHITIIPGGKRCYCGRKGCVDAYVSEYNLSDFTDGNLQQFFDELDSNAGYQSVFNQYLDHLALAVNTLRVCYDCDVILGGNVGSYLSKYIDILKEKTTRLNPFEENSDYIRVCQFKSFASAVGAALHFVQEFIRNI